MNGIQVRFSRKQIDQFCQRYQVRRLALFGSMLRGIIISAVLLVFTFSFIFATPRLRSPYSAGRLSPITRELGVITLECDLASAVMVTQRGDYEQARQSASSFISSLRVKTNKGDGSSFAQVQTKGMQPLYEKRDELISLLARGDLACAGQLSGSYESIHDHDQVSWCT